MLGFIVGFVVGMGVMWTYHSWFVKAKEEIEDDLNNIGQ